MYLKKSLIFIALLPILSLFVSAKTESDTPVEYNPSEVILHHVIDNHDWHITDYKSGDEYKAVALHLPWMFYSSKDGFQFFSSTEEVNASGDYIIHHDHVYAVKAGHADAPHHDDAHDAHHGEETHADSTHHTDEAAAHAEAQHEEGHDHGHGHFDPKTMADKDVMLLDFSFTKTSTQMLIIGFVMLFVFASVAKSYKKRQGKAPKGLQSLLEPIILFVRDDIAADYLPKEKVRKFTPYLLTLFFFIWFSNLLGLMPFNSNISGNISVTAALAVLTFILISFNGSKDYWAHIFWTPGIPHLLRVIMLPVELLGMFTKPFALAIRLFANISAGHFMVLSLISLIFILGDAGANAAGAWGIMPLSVGFTLIIFCLEMLVAIIQAYIFTLLTAVFIGMAMETHDEHH